MDKGGAGRLGMTRLVRSLACFLAIAALCSCGESYASASCSGSLLDGRDGRASVAFSMNRRPVKLELYLRLDGSGALVEIDHPDGRTSEALEISGPGIRKIQKEFEKEPGSWGLRVAARGGAVAYWAILHDRKKYLGPDDDARRLVERK